MSAKIIFTIKKGGEVQERVEGVAGESCESLTRPIEEALGGQVIVQEHTAEYYEQDTNEQGLGAS